MDRLRYRSDDPDLRVCADCFDDSALKDFIEGAADCKECSFCGKTSNEPIAAPLSDVIDLIREGVNQYYDDAANCLPYESAEGGYQGTTWSTYELVLDLGIGFPNDTDDTLFDLVCDGLGDQVWCERDPFGLSPSQILVYSWRAFCKVIKHERRFFFVDHKSRPNSELYDPGEVLKKIFSDAQTIELLRTLPAGKRLFRARCQPIDRVWESVLDLGPPPLRAAKQPNRMSPAGIVMMYVAESPETALRETVGRAATYSIGEFETTRDAVILDLAELPPIPSMFERIPDSLEYDPRLLLIFLHQVADDISKPIARDDRVHIEYVPTQVVTEYLRTVVPADDRPVEGVRYASSRHQGGVSLVLFADQKNLIVPKALRDEYYDLYKDRWIRLVHRMERSVTSADLAVWDDQLPAARRWHWQDEENE